jgi:hypothetical protein
MLINLCHRKIHSDTDLHLKHMIAYLISSYFSEFDESIAVVCVQKKARLFCSSFNSLRLCYVEQNRTEHSIIDEQMMME